MKRLHLHVAVDDLQKSIAFYSTLFGSSPAVVKDDYAKWMLDDPQVNLAISARGRAAGLDHMGIQTETPEELQQLARRLKDAGETTLDQEAATCCYAKSDKAWVSDPSGLRWETFHTHGASTVYGEDEAPVVSDAACSVQETPQGVCCPPKPELAAESSCCGPSGRAPAEARV